MRIWFLLTSEDGWHHCGGHDEERVEEDHSDVVEDGGGIIPDLPVQKSHQDGHDHMKNQTHRRQDLFTRNNTIEKRSEINK
jgi:hypothetical protein